MSSSEKAGDRGAPAARQAAVSTADDEVQAAVATLERLGAEGALSPDAVRTLVSAATRLYAEASAHAGRELRRGSGRARTRQLR